MLSLKTESDVLAEVSRVLRAHRLSLGWRQVDLAKRSGVAVATLRRFESTGQIGFFGLAKLLVSLGLADSFLGALKPPQPAPASLEDFVRQGTAPGRKRAPRHPGKDSSCL